MRSSFKRISRFEILHWLFLMVGVGSTLFHLTLRWRRLCRKYFVCWQARHAGAGRGADDLGQLLHGVHHAGGALFPVLFAWDASELHWLLFFLHTLIYWSLFEECHLIPCPSLPFCSLSGLVQLFLFPSLNPLYDQSTSSDFCRLPSFYIEQARVFQPLTPQLHSLNFISANPEHAIFNFLY